MKVEKVGGKELVVEAISVAAAFEAQTKVTDATVRAKPSSMDMTITKVAQRVLLHRYHIIVSWISLVAGFAVLFIQDQLVLLYPDDGTLFV